MSEHNFRPGDRVLCVDAGLGNHLETGKTYTVERVTQSIVYVDGQGPRGQRPSGVPERFVLVAPEPVDPITNLKAAVDYARNFGIVVDCSYSMARTVL